MSLNSDWRSFVLNEDLDEKTIFTYIQGLQEIINNFKPRTMTERRRLALAKQQIKEVKRHARKMQNEVQILQEKLNILEESLNENEEK
jgi:RNA-splicing ligase RtcB